MSPSNRRSLVADYRPKRADDRMLVFFTIFPILACFPCS